MKNLFGPFISLAGFFLAIFILTKVVPGVMNFFEWWFLTSESVTSVLNTEQIVFIDTITHIVTYSAVGTIFGFFNYWDKKAMHYVYVIISEIVALALAVMLRFILDYYWIIFIIIGVFLLIALTFYIISKKKKEKKDA